MCKDAFSGAAELAGYPNSEGKPWYRLVTNEKYGMNSNRYTGERKEGYPELGEEDKEQFRFLAENAHMQESFNIREIQGTVQEEVEAFFHGDKTAEDVAGIIQSRISVYITPLYNFFKKRITYRAL